MKWYAFVLILRVYDSYFIDSCAHILYELIRK